MSSRSSGRKGRKRFRGRGGLGPTPSPEDAGGETEARPELRPPHDPAPPRPPSRRRGSPRRRHISAPARALRGPRGSRGCRRPGGRAPMLVAAPLRAGAPARGLPPPPSRHPAEALPPAGSFAAGRSDRLRGPARRRHSTRPGPPRPDPPTAPRSPWARGRLPGAGCPQGDPGTEGGAGKESSPATRDLPLASLWPHAQRCLAAPRNCKSYLGLSCSDCCRLENQAGAHSPKFEPGSNSL